MLIGFSSEKKQVEAVPKLKVAGSNPVSRSIVTKVERPPLPPKAKGRRASDLRIFGIFGSAGRCVVPTTKLKVGEAVGDSVDHGFQPRKLSVLRRLPRARVLDHEPTALRIAARNSATSPSRRSS